MDVILDWPMLRKINFLKELDNQKFSWFKKFCHLRFWTKKYGYTIYQSKNCAPNDLKRLFLCHKNFNKVLIECNRRKSCRSIIKLYNFYFDHILWKHYRNFLWYKNCQYLYALILFRNFPNLLFKEFFRRFDVTCSCLLIKDVNIFSSGLGLEV